MKKIKLFILILLSIFISCTKKNKIEDVFTTSKNYYWQYSDTRDYSIGCGTINFRFDKDGYSHRYDFSVKNGYTLNEGLGGDIEIMPQKWYVKKDSTLVWGGFEYKIEHIDHTVIVLSYFLPSDKKQQYWTRLLKVAGEK